MAFRIFHQNMRVFGGGAPGRNAAYTAQFGVINGLTGAVYWAAGFTEISNPNLPLRGILSGLAQTLDPGLTQLVVIEIGTTTLSPTPEYIGIAWDPAAVNVQHAGQVYADPLTNTWAPRRVAAGAIMNQTIRLPAGVAFSADTRGLAYIAGLSTHSGNPFLIGFMHNMYKLGNKSSAFTNLGNMADKVRKLIGGVYVNAEVIIGGDFNLEPRPPKKKRGASLALKSRAARAGGGAIGAVINTTVAHPYDFWTVSFGAITDADARAYLQTRVGLCSDHAGITIRHN